MTKLIKVGILSVALMACAARPAIRATPAQRAQAVAIVMSGGTVRDVAVELSLSDGEARRLVRDTARELMGWLHGSYEAPAGARVLAGPVPAPASPPTKADAGAQGGAPDAHLGVR
jgi:hypothetical protein